MNTKDETKTVAEEQIAKLFSRMLRAEGTDARASFTTQVMAVIKENMMKASLKEFKALVVGAGNSYASAYYIGLAINQIQVGLSDVCTPQEAIGRIGKVRYNMVVAISYSGLTPDIIAVYRELRKEDFYTKFILLTGEEEKVIKDYYSSNDANLKIISYNSVEDKNGREKGCIPFFGVIEPCFIAYNGVFEEHKEEIYKLSTKAANQCDQVLSDIFNTDSNPFKAPKPYVIHIIYDWKTKTVALDLESKLTSSGIAFAVLHEQKEFSHGRYALLYKQDFSMIINISSCEFDVETPYSKDLNELLKDICKEKNKYYLHLIAKENYHHSILEMLMFNAYFVVRLGSCMDVDVSSPFKDNPTGCPKEALKLYSYYEGF